MEPGGGGPDRETEVGVVSGDTDIIGIDRGAVTHKTGIGTKTTIDEGRGGNQQIELAVEVRNEGTDGVEVGVMNGKEIGGNVGIEARAPEGKEEKTEREAAVPGSKNERIHEGIIGLGATQIQDHAEVDLLIVVIEKEGGMGTVIDVDDSK